MINLDLIVGARPNFMKIAPIIKAIEKFNAERETLNLQRGTRNAEPETIKFRLVHTGQHYDANMSGTFFKELGIPEPDVNLNVGSGTQAEQTSGIMLGYEKLLMAAKA